MKKYILLPCVFLLFLSCKEDNEARKENKNIENPETLVSIIDSTDEQIYRAIKQGDTIAYSQVYIEFWKKYKADEILYISLIMANRYKFGEAYFHVYISLSNQYRNDSLGIDGMDNASKYLALYYLLKAKEKGYADAKYEITSVFKDKKVPNSNYYLLKFGEE